MNLNHLNFRGKKIHRLPNFCQNLRNKSSKEVRVDVNFLWVGVGWCELLWVGAVGVNFLLLSVNFLWVGVVGVIFSWVDVGQCELFMSVYEIFMGGCGLV